MRNEMIALWVPPTRIKILSEFLQDFILVIAEYGKFQTVMSNKEDDKMRSHITNSIITNILWILF